MFVYLYYKCIAHINRYISSFVHFSTHTFSLYLSLTLFLSSPARFSHRVFLCILFILLLLPVPVLVAVALDDDGNGADDDNFIFSLTLLTCAHYIYVYVCVRAVSLFVHMYCKYLFIYRCSFISFVRSFI